MHRGEHELGQVVAPDAVEAVGAVAAEPRALVGRQRLGVRGRFLDVVDVLVLLADRLDERGAREAVGDRRGDGEADRLGQRERDDSVAYSCGITISSRAIELRDRGARIVEPERRERDPRRQLRNLRRADRHVRGPPPDRGEAEDQEHEVGHVPMLAEAPALQQRSAGGVLMPDDLSKRTGGDRARISLGEEHEVRYWTEKLGVSREDLERAVKAVGNSPDRVREHLHKH